MDLSRSSKPIALTVFATILLLLGISPAAAQIQGQTGTLQPDSIEAPGLGIYDTPPEPPEGMKEGVEEANPRIPVPIDPDFDPSQLGPDSPPTEIGTRIQPQAPGDYNVFRNSDLNSNPGGRPRSSTVAEPSLGVDGRAVFYTANWLAGFSGDGGRTFDYVNPYDNFPPDGTTDSPSNSGIFCCDQVVYYDRTRGLMIWLLQYQKSGQNPNQDSNIQRIAIADSQEDIINNNWVWYDFAPGNNGYSSTGLWFDFPDLAVSDDHLYYTTNVFNIVSGGDDTYNSTLLIRIPLDDLADGGGISYTFWDNLNTGTLRPVQGAGSRMYLGTHNDNNTLRVYYNDEGSSTLSSQDVNHDGYNTGGMATGCNDGNAFGKRSDTRILGAWRSSNSGEIGFMWNAASGGSFPFPYVRAVRIDPSSWNVEQQVSIWNSNFAFLYPSVHVNDRGHLGGTISFGCGNRDWPEAGAWVIDDTNGFPDLASHTVHPFASSDDAPADSSWGDYLTTRRMVPFGNTWVGSGFRLSGGGGSGDAVPEFLWFGRERDMPPSSRDIYVDLNNTSGFETGTSSHPYSTVGEGEFALQPGDDLIIRVGTYVENVLFDTESNVDNQNGSVIIE